MNTITLIFVLLSTKLKNKKKLNPLSVAKIFGHQSVLLRYFEIVAKYSIQPNVCIIRIQRREL